MGMSNQQGIWYEKMTVAERMEYGLMELTPQEKQKVKNPRVRIEYIPPQRPVMGD
jgi:hypothetical protein